MTESKGVRLAEGLRAECDSALNTPLPLQIETIRSSSRLLELFLPVSS
jgi:hypothetical protein